ncbi:hypothetical protein [Kitasatospora sp. NPDC096204]|uniref:hypothetical protein n=1 Tax=Kitasatospora sp. NPDC096204 TaxID=3364094 RepID=UPI003811BFA7
MHVMRSGTPGTGGRALRTAGALLALLLVGAAAGCGDGGGSGSAATSPAATGATATATVTESAPATEAATETAPTDPAAAKEEVTSNWERFFDPSTSVTDKARLLQDGDMLLPVLQGFAQDPQVGQVQAKVEDVAFTDASHATVTYSLSLQGNAVEPSETGQSVLDNGTWKVSRSTLCGLLTKAGSATGNPIPGCS